MSDEAKPTGIPSGRQVVSMLQKHAVESAQRVYQKLGGPLTVDNLRTYLNDPECLRLPTELVFDGVGVGENTFANPEFILAKGQRRCTLHVRPKLEKFPKTHPFVVAYMAASIIYGAAAGPDVCEAHGALLTGMSREKFCEIITRIAAA